MDLSKKIWYNALTVNGVMTPVAGTPLSGYTVDSVEPAAVDVRGYKAPRATADGMDASDVFLGERRFGAIISVYGSTRGDFWDKAQDLLAAFSPTIAYNADTANLGFLPFNFYQPTADISTWPTSTYPDGIPLLYYVRSAHAPVYLIRRDEDGGQAGLGLSKQFRVTMAARDPRKYLQSESTVTIASTASSATSSIAYLGDYPTTGTITIVSGSATGALFVGLDPASYSLGNPQPNLRFTIDATSTTYTVNLTDRTFSKAGTIRQDLMTVGSTWTWDNMPGRNSTVTIAKSATLCSVSLAFRPAFA